MNTAEQKDEKDTDTPLDKSKTLSKAEQKALAMKRIRIQ